jgi:glucarate dehydratase
MKITKVETFGVNIPYKHPEVSSLISRLGITDIIVKITADNGLVGWGECTRAGDAAGIESAVTSMAPILRGRDPWDKEAIARDVQTDGLWFVQPMTGNFAFGGVDIALWDLCGKECGQPLYRMFGGAMREQVDYFYYMRWGTVDEIVAQAQDGVQRGYTVYYIKAGVDRKREEAMLEALRSTIGPERKIRIDANMAWSVPEAVRILNDWHDRYDIDFAEAPVNFDPIESMQDVQSRVSTSLCLNEGLWKDHDVLRLIKSRAAEYLCYSVYSVGSLRRFHTTVHAASLEGMLVCKHTHGEFGITAAAGQHMMLAAPNASDGNQQTAQHMKDDILKETLPIAEGPTWGRIEGPGLGVEVDEEKLMIYHEDYRRNGMFPPYGDQYA